MSELDKMNSGKLYNPFKVGDSSWKNSKAVIKEFNDSEYWHDNRALHTLRTLFKESYEDLLLLPPFFCDHGHRISIGRHFQANTGLLILDEAEVKIGNDVYMGPRCCIYTVNHPMVPSIRNMDLEIAAPVTIEDSCWLGGNVIVCAGVTIGKGSVIGAGSVVTHDIPPGVFAAGNPCKVIREIDENDEAKWQALYREYIGGSQ